MNIRHGVNWPAAIPIVGSILIVLYILGHIIWAATRTG